MKLGSKFHKYPTGIIQNKTKPSLFTSDSYTRNGMSYRQTIAKAHIDEKKKLSIQEINQCVEIKKKIVRKSFIEEL